MGDDLPFEATADILREFLSRHSKKEEAGFANSQHSPALSLLLFYLNSGHFRFDGYKEYDATCNGSAVDEEEIARQVRDEILTEDELATILQSFLRSHSHTGGEAYGCAACGIRLLSREQRPKIQYEKFALAAPEMQLLKLSSEQECEFLKEKSLPPLCVPTDRGLCSKTGEVWKVRSVHQSPSHGLFHLHPELVDRGTSGEEHCMVCPDCATSLNNGEAPKLSIAGGVDFGVWERFVDGSGTPILTEPVLMEKIVLARTRLVMAAIKVSSNHCGQVHLGGGATRMNAVLFADETAYDTAMMLSGEEMFEVGRLKSLLKVYLLDSHGNIDFLHHQAFGRTNLLARPWVVWQWLLFLKCTHPMYKDLRVPSWSTVQKNMDSANKSIRENCVRITDGTAMAFENRIGSDIAEVLGTEVPYSGGDAMPPPHQQQVLGTEVPYSGGGAMPPPHQQHAEHHRESQEGAPSSAGGQMDRLECSYVTTEASQGAEGSSAVRRAKLRSLRRLAGGRPPASSIRDAGRDDDESSSGDSFSPQDAEDLKESPAGRAGEPGTLYCGRDAEPLCEFLTDDYNIATCFPDVFPLGRVYGRPIGSLSHSQRSHLLQQFTKIPSKDRRLIGHMYDATSRTKVIAGVNCYTRDNELAKEIINKLLEDEEQQALLNLAIQNPDSELGRCVYKKYSKCVKYSARQISFAAGEGCKIKSQITESTMRYGSPSAFLTYSIEGKSNPRAIRLCHRTVNNTTFPAQFTEGSKFGSDGADFIDKLRDQSIPTGQGQIMLDEEWRANAETADPATFVAQSKQMVNDILSLLLGIPPQDFFAKADGVSRRKTKYFMCNKGVLGHALAYIGIVEAHSRGALHYHVLFFGSLPPYVLQRFAGIPSICREIQAALDSMYTSSIPLPCHLPGVLRRMKAGKPRLKVRWGKICDPMLKPPVYFAGQVSDPLNMVRSPPPGNTWEAPQQCVAARLRSHTEVGAGLQQAHVHMSTCHKGLIGATGCRMCMPMGLREATSPVLLEAITSEEQLHKVWEEDMESGIYVSDKCTEEATVAHLPCLASAAAATEAEGQNDVSTKYFTSDPTPGKPEGGVVFRVLPSIPSSYCPTTYTTRDPLEKALPTSVVVWETKRPTLPLLPGDGELSRADMIQQSRGAVGESQVVDDKFWECVCALSDEHFTSFYSDLSYALSRANGYIATYNQATSFCTGSHNNYSLLGADTQAKAAVFYLCPYMGKQKYPLEHSLSILWETVLHNLKHPSKAGDTGSRDRNTKYILQHTLNKMNLKMEISPEQQVAALLDFSSILHSDSFAYLNPHDHMGCSTRVLHDGNVQELMDRLHAQRDDDRYRAAVADGSAGLSGFLGGPPEAAAAGGAGHSTIPVYDQEDLLKDIGHIKIYTFVEGDTTRAVLVPECSFYPDRGEGLKELSRHEYAALIKVERRGKLDRNKRRTAFLLGEKHPCFAQYAQYLRAVQCTVIVTRKAPPHPGINPGRGTDEEAAWREKANRYAKYYLTIFRPERLCYEQHQLNKYGYAWEDLVDFITHMQSDTAVLSKFRLAAMHTRMKGFATPYSTKVMLMTYRGRNRDKHTRRAQESKHLTPSREQEENDRLVDETMCNLPHPPLDPRANTQTMLQIAFDKDQCRAYRKCALPISQTQNAQVPPSTPFPVPDASAAVIGDSPSSGGHPPSTNAWVSRSPLYEAIVGGQIQHIGKALRGAAPCAINHAQQLNPSLPSEGRGDSEQFFRARDAEEARQENTRLEMVSTLKRRQRWVYETHRDYFADPYSHHPPPVVLLHGCAGTGKSAVVSCIVGEAKAQQCDTLRTAYNHINALHMGGSTTASILKLQSSHANNLCGFHATELQEFREKMARVRLIIVDEVSNQAPWHIARLHTVCQQATSRFDLLFGGIPVLLVGDFHQLGPVKAGLGLTEAFCNVLENVWVPHGVGGITNDHEDRPE